MNPLAILLLLACSIAILTVPRRWAAVPLLIGCCYMTKGQGIELGFASFTVFRLLLLVGLARIILRGERIEGPFNLIDKLMIAWAAWMILASFTHVWESGSGPVFTIGAVFDQVQIYMLVRIWCRDLRELAGVIGILAILLVPIAAAMVIEKLTAKNLFSVFGGVPMEAIIREGKLRAQASFRHPILAGTVGAVVFPLMVAILSRRPLTAIIGMTACVMMVIASASSGPAMSLIFGICGLVMWRWRNLVRPMLWCGAIGYVVLALVMPRPPYYLIARIDVTGGSTGYHRAMLIEQTFKHLNEWWLFGTDATRHWMPNQGWISEKHTDITNYYIAYGVEGGLPAMLLVIAMLVVAFRWVGASVRNAEEWAPEWAFPAWCCGCGLLAHATTSISVAYFDQSMLFFWLNVAVIASMHTALQSLAQARQEELLEPAEAEEPELAYA